MYLEKDKLHPRILEHLFIELRASGVKRDMTPAIDSHSLSL